MKCQVFGILHITTIKNNETLMKAEGKVAVNLLGGLFISPICTTFTPQIKGKSVHAYHI